MQNLITKISILFDLKDIFWNLFWKYWIIKLYFHLPLNFVYMNSRKIPGYRCFFLYIKEVLYLRRKERHLTLSWRRSLSYRNQSIDLQSKSMDWLLYDKNLPHQRVEAITSSVSLWRRPCHKNVLSYDNDNHCRKQYKQVIK